MASIARKSPSSRRIYGLASVVWPNLKTRFELGPTDQRVAAPCRIELVNYSHPPQIIGFGSGLSQLAFGGEGTP